MTIVQRVLDDVCAHAAAEAPRECCGMLIGTADAIVESIRARNLAKGNSRFLIDPQDHVAAIRHARARAMDVVGFYHSHPRSAAFPSQTDIAESGYAGVVHLIAGVSGGAVDLRLFRINGTEVEGIAFQQR